MLDLRENYKTYLWVILGAIVICIFVVWIMDISGGEEKRVRKFILQGKNAVESKDLLSFPDMISTSYHDKYENDRPSLLFIIKEVFSYYDKLSVNITRMDIKFDDKKTQATVEMSAQVIGQLKRDSDNSAASAKEENILEGKDKGFMMKLTKEEGKWRLLETEFFEPMTMMGETFKAE